MKSCLPGSVFCRQWNSRLWYRHPLRASKSDPPCKGWADPWPKAFQKRSLAISCFSTTSYNKYAREDSNLEPTDYESGALTVELRALSLM